MNASFPLTHFVIVFLGLFTLSCEHGMGQNLGI